MAETELPTATPEFLTELQELAETIIKRGQELTGVRQILDDQTNEIGVILPMTSALLKHAANDLVTAAQSLMALRAKAPVPPTAEQLEYHRIVLLTGEERHEIKSALEGDSNDAEHDVLVELAQNNSIEYTSFEDQDDDEDED